MTYGTAKGYVQSAFLLMANPLRLQLPDDTTVFLSFHMLIAFAVELYLKAYARSKGVSAERLKARDAGHNLAKLLSIAADVGLPSGSGAHDLVRILGPKHKTLEYRYLRDESKFESAGLGQLFTLLSYLDDEVDAAVGASASVGKPMGAPWVFPTEFANWRL